MVHEALLCLHEREQAGRQLPPYDRGQRQQKHDGRKEGAEKLPLLLRPWAMTSPARTTRQVFAAPVAWSPDRQTWGGGGRGSCGSGLVHGQRPS